MRPPQGIASAADLYVEVHTVEDGITAEAAADQVSGILRGMGIGTCDDAVLRAGVWPGGADRFIMDERGDDVRLVTWWPTVQDARRTGDRLTRYLEANGWGHHGALGRVWVHDRMTGTDVVVRWPCEDPSSVDA